MQDTYEILAKNGGGIYCLLAKLEREGEKKEEKREKERARGRERELLVLDDLTFFSF